MHGGRRISKKGATHRSEHALVCFVGDPVLKRYIQRVPTSFPPPSIVQGARAREVLAIFMEGDGEHTVGRVKCLLDTVTVVAVNVDVDDAREVAEEVEDGTEVRRVGREEREEEGEEREVAFVADVVRFVCG